MKNIAHKISETRSPTGKARFVLIDPAAREVSVAGAFNNWNPTATPLINVGQGHWVLDLTLPLGRHEYQFVVDGRWMPDRKAKELAENPFGGLNSILEVQRPQFTLAAPKPADKHVNPKWAWHHRALVQLRERLLKDRCEQISEAAAPAVPRGTHLADCASEELDQELAVAELDAEEDLLFEVEQAIQRILDGTYGKCQVTGNPIPAARLRAIPWTPFSKQVEEELERLHAMQPALN